MFQQSLQIERFFIDANFILFSTSVSSSEHELLREDRSHVPIRSAAWNDPSAADAQMVQMGITADCEELPLCPFREQAVAEADAYGGAVMKDGRSIQTRGMGNVKGGEPFQSVGGEISTSENVDQGLGGRGRG